MGMPELDTHIETNIAHIEAGHRSEQDMEQFRLALADRKFRLEHPDQPRLVAGVTPAERHSPCLPHRGCVPSDGALASTA